jgi:hypothetical protein
MSTAPYKNLSIKVDNKNYFFTVEEFHSNPVPAHTIMVISERTLDDSFHPLPKYDHQYIAVDEGYTATSHMIQPLQVKMNTFILTCVIPDREERKKVVQYFRDTAIKQQKEG